MTAALVETGRQGRCVQVEASEIATTGGNFGPDGRVIDHWQMWPAEDVDQEGRYVATLVQTGDEVDPTYLVVVTSTDTTLVRTAQRANLPLDLAISVDALIVLPKLVQTDRGARQVMRRLMMAAADDDVPMRIGDLGYDRACWQHTAVGIVRGLTTAHEAS